MAEQVVTARSLIGGEWVSSPQLRDVVDPFRGNVVGRVPEGDEETVQQAVAVAASAAGAAAAVPGYRRAQWIDKAAALLDERAKDIATLMSREMGKAIKDSLAEVRRSKDTLVLSAQEAVRIEGEHVPLDSSELGAGKRAFLLRYPVGVVGAITPFNAPFNLAAHKIAPALAAGNTVVLKAPPQAPLTVWRLAELFQDAGVPKGFLNVVHGGADEGRALVTDPRVAFITFTGSSRAGAEIARTAGLRRVALELGGTGSTIIHSDADVDAASAVCARNAVRLAGQSCISVQNVYAHRSVYQQVVASMAATMNSLLAGDPLDEKSDVGTLVDEAAARRVEAWVNEAVAGGAHRMVGGSRQGALYPPTLLTSVRPDMRIVCDEVFGPVANVIPYDDVFQVAETISGDIYGLQCGLFTNDSRLIFSLLSRLRVGGVIVNGSSTWRTDQLAVGAD